jgi:hypothetical protein
MTDFITELAKEINTAFNIHLADPDTLKPIVITAADNTLKAAVAGGHRDATLTRQEIAYIVAALTVGQNRQGVLKALKPKKG